jgi:hypothetical protein
MQQYFSLTIGMIPALVSPALKPSENDAARISLSKHRTPMGTEFFDYRIPEAFLTNLVFRISLTHQTAHRILW